MNWRIEFTPKAHKELTGLTVVAQRRIVAFLETRVAPLDDPRILGAALTGPLKGHWKYRVGDYRIVAKLEDHRIAVVVVRIGNRREVYR